MIIESITLREAAADDTSFLVRLYRDTRYREVSAWGWPREQQEQFLRMQFNAQQKSYEAAFPDAVNRIVLREEVPIGRLLTSQEAESMRLIDIALIEEQRQQGIGTHLLRTLLQQCEARGCILHLNVAHGSPAVRFYQRMGFLQVGGDPMYLQMEWTPFSNRKYQA